MSGLSEVPSLQSTVGRCSNQLTAPMEDGQVVMSLESGKYFGFDDIGNLVWSALEQPRRLDDLVDELCLRSDGVREIVVRDVLAFVVRLQERGLVVIT